MVLKPAGLGYCSPAWGLPADALLLHLPVQGSATTVLLHLYQTPMNQGNG